MPTRESRVFSNLKERLCHPRDRFERIENGLDSGWPDVNYCFFGKEGWIELKAPEQPARAETGVLSSGHPVGVEQSNWMLRQHRAGGRAFLFVATDQNLILIRAETVAEDWPRVNKMPLAELKEEAAWWSPTGVRGMDHWLDLRGILRS